MIVIIIADSFKKGMKSRGCAGLLPYNKKNNLLQQQIETVRHVFPKSDIVYIYGFDSKRLNNFAETLNTTNIQYILNKKHDIFNHGHSLSLVKDNIAGAEECLILLGYDPIQLRTIDKVKKSRKSSVVVDPKNKSKLGCIFDQATKCISHIFFDLDNSVSDIYFLKKPEIDILCGILEDQQINNMFLFEIMNNIISRKGKLEALSLAK